MKNNLIILSVGVIALLFVLNYESSKLSESKQSQYDLQFNDFYLYNTSNKGTDLIVKSEKGTLKKDNFKLINTTIERKSMLNKTSSTEKIQAKHVEFKDKILLFKDSVGYESANNHITSQNIKYDLNKNELSAKNSISKFGGNVIKSANFVFDVKNQNFQASEIDSVLQLEK